MFAKIRRDERGQAMVEMALILPVLLILILGIVELGRLYNAYLIIDHATREGVRLGSVGGSDSEITSKVKSLSTTLPQNSNITVEITPSMANRVRGNDISVKTDYTFTFITPLIGNILGNPFNVSSKVIMRIE